MARIASIKRLKATLGRRGVAEDYIDDICEQSRSSHGTKQRRVTIDDIRATLHHFDLDEECEQIIDEACGELPPAHESPTPQQMCD